MELQDHLHKLNYFVRVVEAGSIKQGSAQAFLSQPQMTRVIKQLEDTVGAQLFVRSKSGVEVTKAGADLYNLALKINRQVDDYMYSVKELSVPLAASLRIGTYDSIARYFFPNFLTYFESRNPKFKIYLETGRSSAIASKVKNKQLDIGIIVNAKDHKGVQYTLAYKDAFGLYTSLGLKKEKINNLIYFDFPMNDVGESMKRFKFVDSARCDNLETVKELTESGLGVGLLPHRVARDGVLNGNLVPYRHPKIKSNYFDEHSVDVCFLADKQAESFSYFKEELHRYLQLWAKK